MPSLPGWTCSRPTVLAPDVVLVADGADLAPAARHPVEGGERPVALLARFSHVEPGAQVTTLLLNGAVAARIDPAGELNTAVPFVVEDGRIARIDAIRNPHKLGRLENGGGAAAVSALRLRHVSCSLGDRPARPSRLREPARRPGFGTRRKRSRSCTRRTSVPSPSTEARPAARGGKHNPGTARSSRSCFRCAACISRSAVRAPWSRGFRARRRQAVLADVDAARASHAAGACKHQSGGRAASDHAGGIGQLGPRRGALTRRRSDASSRRLKRSRLPCGCFDGLHQRRCSRSRRCPWAVAQARGRWRGATAHGRSRTLPRTPPHTATQHSSSRRSVAITR
jgi:hypothetical protein